jgi:hypothetical protein
MTRQFAVYYFAICGGISLFFLKRPVLKKKYFLIFSLLPPVSLSPKLGINPRVLVFSSLLDLKDSLKRKGFLYHRRGGED